MDDEIKRLAKNWNVFVRRLESTRRAWEAVREQSSVMNRALLGDADPVLQRVMSIFGRMPWVEVVPRFIGYLKGIGNDTNSVIIPVGKKTEGKEEKDNG